ncbi:sigma-70 family RNA polymerase sigma factor [Xylanimonas allomyrinae]|uniref:Sigma-70 family RNA polymerase sigma factor n=1 Tax=Xylanimonas allomyrinae TaxID=2509459 RepID=A0A4P6EJQ8_9MICO|nr:sigma-70 family RNA polymerase sigma factor [Xylanimonas allomyrinae]QAY62802.1 sigma-70 family RNA polymerase sigma factor [Xylanimonas allomyrinae]
MPPEALQNASFTRCFRTNYDDIHAYLARRVDPQLADDLTAEVFARAWNAWHNAPEPARPWLFGIARHLVADRYRAQNQEDELHARLDNERTNTQDEVGGVETALDVRAAWAQLPGRDREVLALIAWDGLTVSEAAAALHLPRPAFSMRLTRARRRLKHLLEQGEPAPMIPSLERSPR